ncbi:MAG TPA: YgaP-like transmembrane domain [Vicinamibacterales bacterium]|nr:YgaP-like transmembrane domain [Vicinamibacterales bacterium]
MTGATDPVITVFGADWCEDTRRARRHLRRLGVAYSYRNVDEDLDALERAKALNAGKRRTPIIDLGRGSKPLVEPDNRALTGALIELSVLTPDEAHDLMEAQNVGDLERLARMAAGLALLAYANSLPRGTRWPAALAGTVTALSGIVGWCPVYQYAGVTSLGGPGDRPDESERRDWLAVQDGGRRPAAASLPENGA